MEHPWQFESGQHCYVSGSRLRPAPRLHPHFVPRHHLVETAQRLRRSGHPPLRQASPRDRSRRQRPLVHQGAVTHPTLTPLPSWHRRRPWWRPSPCTAWATMEPLGACLWTVFCKATRMTMSTLQPRRTYVASWPLPMRFPAGATSSSPHSIVEGHVHRRSSASTQPPRWQRSSTNGPTSAPTITFLSRDGSQVFRRRSTSPPYDHGSTRPGVSLTLSTQTSRSALDPESPTAPDPTDSDCGMTSNGVSQALWWVLESEPPTISAFPQHRGEQGGIGRWILPTRDVDFEPMQLQRQRDWGQLNIVGHQGTTHGRSPPGTQDCGMGVMEASYISGLGLLGVHQDQAIAATLTYRASTPTCHRCGVGGRSFGFAGTMRSKPEASDGPPGGSTLRAGTRGSGTVPKYSAP